MRFGRALYFDNSGEKNIPRGIPPQQNLRIQFDKIGQQHFVCRRNHPCVIQEPYSFDWFGANNDIQPLLINTTGAETIQKIGCKEYEKFTCNLVAAGANGLEHYNGVHIMEEYVTSYSCKGDEYSANWLAAAHAITEEYCSRPDTQEKNIRAIVGANMYEITAHNTVTCDQSQFCLGGGHVKKNQRVHH